MSLVISWKGTVSTDKDKTDVGVASATYKEWDDADPEVILFQCDYSERIRMTQAEKDAFVIRAKQAMADKKAKDARDKNLTSILNLALNA